VTADCEPNWRDTPTLDQLHTLTAHLRYGPHQQYELRAQGLTGRDIANITDIAVSQEYL
jgi:hypothetical protein